MFRRSRRATIALPVGIDFDAENGRDTKSYDVQLVTRNEQVRIQVEAVMGLRNPQSYDNRKTEILEAAAMKLVPSRICEPLRVFLKSLSTHTLDGRRVSG